MDGCLSVAYDINSMHTPWSPRREKYTNSAKDVNERMTNCLPDLAENRQTGA